MKSTLLMTAAVLLSTSLFAQSPAELTERKPASTYALFSPHQGEKAFNEIYKLVKNAEEYVHVAIYSWSDSGIDKAMMEALKNGAKVRIVLHPPLAKKDRTIAKVKKLEDAGAEVKIAKHNMHEKIVIVDGEHVVNTSANMSGGAKTKYSEAFIFHSKTSSNKSSTSKLIKDFRHEFTILWNSGRDMITDGEEIAEQLTDYPNSEGDVVTNLPAESGNAILYSSSTNFKVKINKPTSSAYKQGKYITLQRRKDSTGEQTWKVRDALQEAIEQADTSIHCALNHFNIRSVSDKLIEAVKRGVEVKLAVDNQEYKSKPNNKEMTPQFVQDWKALPGNKNKVAPVRVKYYAHAPSPRHWLLNHHKYCVVDFGTKKVKLLAGSYNVSKNAEHKQFDNLVLYKGSTYKNLYGSFMKEFENLWSFNRNAEDKPLASKMDQFFSDEEDRFRLHVKEAVSLTYPEVRKLRRDVGKAAKGIFSNLWKKKDCLYYSPKNQNYFGCPK